jgi:hypothetical protein
LKVKITAADINLSTKNKWHMAGQGNLFHIIEKRLNILRETRP